MTLDFNAQEEIVENPVPKPLGTPLTNQPVVVTSKRARTRTLDNLRKLQDIQNRIIGKETPTTQV